MHDAIAACVAGAVGAMIAGQPVPEPRRPNRKLDNFEASDPVAWTTWRTHFERVADINEWTNRRARREMAAAMHKEAALYVAGIDIGADAAVLDANVQPFGLLLDEYQTKFVSEAAGDLARAHVRSAAQGEDEAIAKWHNRCLYLFRRAYPGIGLADLNVNPDLRDIFMTGLADRATKVATMRARPNTYALCLTTAQAQAATGMTLDDNIKPDPSIFGIGHTGSNERRKNPDIECFYCQKKGHIERMCRAKIADKNKSGSGRGSFKSARGGRGGRREGRSDSRKEGRWSKSSIKPRPAGPDFLRRIASMVAEETKDHREAQAGAADMDNTEAYGSSGSDSGN